MTERYDKQEKMMGISAYASPQVLGFAAVSKARYSDFVVHEGTFICIFTYGLEHLKLIFV